MAVTRRLTFCGLALAIQALVANGAFAQGFFGSAGVAVDQGYESNLFATPDGFGPGASDLIMRVGPSVEVGYRSPLVDLIGRYTLLGERYTEYRGLSRRIGQQDGRIELAYWPTRRLAVGGAGTFIETNSPQAILSSGSLIYGRLPAHRLTVAPAITYDFSASYSLSAEYDFIRESLAAQADNVIHAPHLAFEWNATPRTTWSVLYRARRFGAPGDPPELSQAWMAGWERLISRFTEIEVSGGARLFENEVRPELEATIRRRLRRGDLYLTAAQSETSMLGARGIMNTRSLTAGISLQVARYIRLSTSPSLLHTWRGTASGTVRAVELEALAYVARGVSLVVSGIAARQRGNLGGPIESIPVFSVQAGVRVLVPGRPREDMARDDNERRERETSRRPGVRSR